MRQPSGNAQGKGDDLYSKMIACRCFNRIDCLSVISKASLVLNTFLLLPLLLFLLAIVSSSHMALWYDSYAIIAIQYHKLQENPEHTNFLSILKINSTNFRCNKINFRCNKIIFLHIGWIFLPSSLLILIPHFHKSKWNCEVNWMRWVVQGKKGLVGHVHFVQVFLSRKTAPRRRQEQ